MEGSYRIPDTNDALLDECDVQTFRGSGPGGQSVNTADSAVRLTHRPTGIVVVCRRERSQLLNKNACLRRLRERLEEAEAERNRPERRETRVPRSVKAARLTGKRVTSAKKRMRGRVDPDQD